MSVGLIRQNSDDIGLEFTIFSGETGTSASEDREVSVYRSRILGERIADILSVVEARVRRQYKRRRIFPVQEVLRRQSEETRRISS